VKISIIIPAFNEEKLIAETLRRISLACDSFHQAGWSTELIVCDNNSTDRTPDLAKAAGARVVFEPINQIARSRNAGAGVATGDWLLFIDADSHPEPGLFTDVAAIVSTGACFAAGSTIRLDGVSLGLRLGSMLWNFISRVSRSPAGSFFLCEAALFREVGGFNQELFASEELDLSKRLKKSAGKSGRRMIILHRHPLTTSSRKLHLYSGWEYFRFLLRTALGFGRTLKSAEECHIWYDGRR
jgi:glycosyltransferase involved in cell wall biosynthesis